MNVYSLADGRLRFMYWKIRSDGMKFMLMFLIGIAFGFLIGFVIGSERR